MKIVDAKCKNCGAELTFDSDKTMLFCPYCGTKLLIIDGDEVKAEKELKKELIEYLQKKGYNIENYGTDTPESIDYPLIAQKVVNSINNGICSKGILICGTGIGMSLCANRVHGIRAVACSDTTTAKYSRLHNDSNILCLGARIIGTEKAKDICDIWLNTEFENEERHLRRINLIEKF